MKNLIKIGILGLTAPLLLNSCMVFPDDTSGPPEPGQTVFRSQQPQRTVIYRENTRYVPQPSQKTVIYERNNTEYIPEPGQTEFRTERRNESNPPEPGQTEFRTENENNPPEPGQTEMKTQNETEDN
ncbi:hypothetical protein [Elizabethkingia sp. JS20170427COW]|uniref:hypothetical protein n=1 Tax=Elizabethkingia sp. JS20170427COW TaxID=2583851 RepID=UPI0011102A3E|nr:hypothetical protein [Elizabethkingia sp. JS20170427COW]QCX52676.1 hypothetical protein FGE20_02395 [Elizabethkingia sp. JS20170427COW]